MNKVVNKDLEEVLSQFWEINLERSAKYGLRIIGYKFVFGDKPNEPYTLTFKDGKRKHLGLTENQQMRLRTLFQNNMLGEFQEEVTVGESKYEKTWQRCHDWQEVSPGTPYEQARYELKRNF